MGILNAIIVALSVITMIVGYLKETLSLDISQMTWIAVGNIGILIGYLMHLRDERKKWRKFFLDENPNYKHYEQLWKLMKLLADARLYLIPGNLPGEGRLEKWHSEVRSILRNWHPDYEDRYILNDKPNLGHRICQLEQALDSILVNTNLGKGSL